MNPSGDYGGYRGRGFRSRGRGFSARGRGGPSIPSAAFVPRPRGKTPPPRGAGGGGPGFSRRFIPKPNEVGYDYSSRDREYPRRGRGPPSNWDFRSGGGDGRKRRTSVDGSPPPPMRRRSISPAGPPPRDYSPRHARRPSPSLDYGSSSSSVRRSHPDRDRHFNQRGRSPSPPPSPPPVVIQRGPSPSHEQRRHRRPDPPSEIQHVRNPNEPTSEELQIAEKVIAYGMETSRLPWLGIHCLVNPTFLVISDGPLSRLVFDPADLKRGDFMREGVDLTRVKPNGTRVVLYNDVDLRALGSNDRFFRKLASMVGNEIPAQAYVLIGRNDIKAEESMPMSTLRDRMMKFFDRLHEQFSGTEISWIGIGDLPYTSPHRSAAHSLAHSLDSGSTGDRSWLHCANVCGDISEEDLLRGGDAWTKQFAHVFGTNLCHRMKKDLKEFRMQRIRQCFNLPGPKSSVGIGDVTLSFR